MDDFLKNANFGKIEGNSWKSEMKFYNRLLWYTILNPVIFGYTIYLGGKWYLVSFLWFVPTVIGLGVVGIGMFSPDTIMSMKLKFAKALMTGILTVANWYRNTKYKISKWTKR